jgi:hypothetical protein
MTTTPQEPAPDPDVVPSGDPNTNPVPVEDPDANPETDPDLA